MKKEITEQVEKIITVCDYCEQPETPGKVDGDMFHLLNGMDTVDIHGRCIVKLVNDRGALKEAVAE